jgi:hypothetical protein
MVEPIKTGAIEFPQASMIFAGGPGSTASAGQTTVVDPFAGGVSALL